MYYVRFTAPASEPPRRPRQRLARAAPCTETERAWFSSGEPAFCSRRGDHLRETGSMAPVPHSPAKAPGIRSGRTANQLRPVSLTPDYVATAEGSVLISIGHTRVLCNATIEQGVPPWLRNSGRGW